MIHAVLPLAEKPYKDKRADAIFRGEFVKGLDGQIQQRAREKLKYLDAAANIGDLRVPPGNQLEALKGDRKGQHSIRINQQWRLCFRWSEGEALDVEIIDYH
jgi:toxin HigB-1